MIRAFRNIVRALLVGVVAFAPGTASASVTAQAAREAAEFVLQKFGKTAAAEGAEKLAVRIERAGAKYGDDAVAAVRKVGPRALSLADEAGENGTAIVRLAARHGDEGLVLAQKPRSLALYAQYGDEAAEAMIKHADVAEPLIEAHGKRAAAALVRVTPQNGRRLEMMRAAGDLQKIGRTDAVLGTVAKYGDRGMDFVWKHKAALATAAVLATFLADPEPYIEGVKDITRVGLETVAKPLAELPGDVATEIARGTDWTPVVLTALAVAAALVVVRMWLRRSPK